MDDLIEPQEFVKKILGFLYLNFSSGGLVCCHTSLKQFLYWLEKNYDFEFVDSSSPH